MIQKSLEVGRNLILKAMQRLTDDVVILYKKKLLKNPGVY